MSIVFVIIVVLLVSVLGIRREYHAEVVDSEFAASADGEVAVLVVTVAL